MLVLTTVLIFGLALWIWISVDRAQRERHRKLAERDRQR